MDDWLPVKDLDTNDELGQIRVTLAAGRDAQIKHLMPQHRSPAKKADEEKKKTSSHGIVEDIEDDEHIYDTVHEESFESEDLIKKTTGGQAEEASPSALSSTSSTTLVEASSSSGESLPSQEEAPSPPPPALPPSRRTQVNQKPPAALNFEGSSAAEKQQLFRIKLSLDEARNLSRVFDPVLQERVAPSTYLTFTSGSKTVRTNCIHTSSHPQWAFRTVAEISGEILTDPKRHFILKLWHHPNSGSCSEIDLENDHVIGFVAIDLHPFRSGFPQICGWYNVMDFIGRCRGQVKVTVKPLMNPEEIRSMPGLPYLARRESTSSQVCCGSSGPFLVETRYQTYPSHLVQHTEQIISPCSSPEPQKDARKVSTQVNANTTFQREGENPLPSLPTVRSLHATQVHPKPSDRQDETTKACFWNPPLPESATEDTTKSMLERKMTDLEETTKRLKEKLRLADASSTHTSNAPHHQDPPSQGCDSSNPNNNNNNNSLGKKDFSKLSLEELQTNIDSHLRRISEEQEQRERARENDACRTFTKEAAATANNNNNHSGQFSTTTASSSSLSGFPGGDENVSAEICDVLSSDDAHDVSDSQIEALLDGNGGGVSGNLADLNTIDWSQVLATANNNSSNNNLRGGIMRNTPEGGNPQDQSKI